MKNRAISAGIVAAALCLSHSASAFTIGQYIEQGERWLKCESTDPAVRAVCGIVSAEVNARLSTAGIRLEAGDIVYEMNGFANVDRSEGCKKLSTRSSNFQVALNTHVPMRFEGNLIDAPFVATMTLPAHVHGDVRVREKSRTNYGGGCADPTTSDDWDLVADADVTAYSKLIVSLEPRFGFTANGDYEITVKPFVGVETAMSDLDMATHIRGRDHAWFGLHDAFNAFTGIHTGLAFDTPLFLGGLMSAETFVARWRATAIDAGFALISSALVLDNAVLGQAIQAKLSRMAETEAQKIARENMKKLEASLNGQIARALGLDRAGETRFVVPLGRLPARTPPAPEEFIKHGNNGAVSCNAFCRGAQYGEVGTCTGALLETSHPPRDPAVTCASVPGRLRDGELVCSCVKD